MNISVKEIGGLLRYLPEHGPKGFPWLANRHWQTGDRKHESALFTRLFGPRDWGWNWAGSTPQWLDLVVSHEGLLHYHGIVEEGALFWCSYYGTMEGRWSRGRCRRRQFCTSLNCVEKEG